ncbi:hypothetical protein F5878DRAFT_664705 [Lentinula raphanica]|uniref:Uncharacterized protein n=1 Tax=Lentinula raphanica TaxID=153919 RepID=A0AA38P1F2_9AGAR|nr:hypothetical protein F5878DRAFT_664705 [Lentinula raphanica]
MSSKRKIRLISADTWRIRRLEEQALLKHEEVIQLRDEVCQLRSQYGLQVDTLRLKSDLDVAMNSTHKLRIQILASLGCDIAEAQCLNAIFTDEARKARLFQPIGVS